MGDGRPRRIRRPATVAGALLALAALGCMKQRPAAPPAPDLPDELAGRRADGPSRTYDRDSVYGYLNGGAEVYLAYGMRTLAARTYLREGEPPLRVDLFQMDSPAGAYGAFSFEREDDDVGVGQGSEYAAGLLRFWQGTRFATVQAERETPATREDVLAVGRRLAALAGPPGEIPTLVAALPPDGLRPTTVRYLLAPEQLAWHDRIAEGDPLGLTAGAEAVLARYGEVGDPTRVLLVRSADAAAAAAARGGLAAARLEEADAEGLAQGEDGTWSGARAEGRLLAAVFGASSRESAAALLAAALARGTEEDR